MNSLSVRVGIDKIDPEQDPFQDQDHNDIHRCGSFDSQLDDSQATLPDSTISASSMNGGESTFQSHSNSYPHSGSSLQKTNSNGKINNQVIERGNKKNNNNNSLRHHKKKQQQLHDMDEDDKENFTKFKAHYQQKHPQQKKKKADGTYIHIRPSEDLDFKGSLYSGPEFQDLMKALENNRHDSHFDSNLYNSSIKSNGHGQSHRHTIAGGTVGTEGVTEFGELTTLNIQRLNNNNDHLLNINKSSTEMSTTDFNTYHLYHPYHLFHHRHSWTQNVHYTPRISPDQKILLEDEKNKKVNLKNTHHNNNHINNYSSEENYHSSVNGNKKNVGTNTTPVHNKNSSNSLMSSVIQKRSDIPNNSNLSYKENSNTNSCQNNGCTTGGVDVEENNRKNKVQQQQQQQQHQIIILQPTSPQTSSMFLDVSEHDTNISNLNSDCKITTEENLNTNEILRRSSLATAPLTDGVLNTYEANLYNSNNTSSTLISNIMNKSYTSTPNDSPRLGGRKYHHGTSLLNINNGPGSNNRSGGGGGGLSSTPETFQKFVSSSSNNHTTTTTTTTATTTTTTTTTTAAATNTTTAATNTTASNNTSNNNSTGDKETKTKLSTLNTKEEGTTYHTASISPLLRQTLSLSSDMIIVKCIDIKVCQEMRNYMYFFPFEYNYFVYTFEVCKAADPSTTYIIKGRYSLLHEYATEYLEPRLIEVFKERRETLINLENAEKALRATQRKTISKQDKDGQGLNNANMNQISDENYHSRINNEGNVTSTTFISGKQNGILSPQFSQTENVPLANTSRHNSSNTNSSTNSNTSNNNYHPHCNSVSGSSTPNSRHASITTSISSAPTVPYNNNTILVSQNNHKLNNSSKRKNSGMATTTSPFLKNRDSLNSIRRRSSLSNGNLNNFLDNESINTRVQDYENHHGEPFTMKTGMMPDDLRKMILLGNEGGINKNRLPEEYTTVFHTEIEEKQYILGVDDNEENDSSFIVPLKVEQREECYPGTTPYTGCPSTMTPKSTSVLKSSPYAFTLSPTNTSERESEGCLSKDIDQDSERQNTYNGSQREEPDSIYRDDRVYSIEALEEEGDEKSTALFSNSSLRLPTKDHQILRLLQTQLGIVFPKKSFSLRQRKENDNFIIERIKGMEAYWSRILEDEEMWNLALRLEIILHEDLYKQNQ